MHPGVIARLNNLHKPSDGDGVSLEEYEASMCSALIGLGMASDMASSRHLLSTVPLDEMEAAMSARADSLKSPEQRKTDELKKLAKEDIDKARVELQEKGWDKFFDGFTGGLGTKKQKITDLKPPQG